MLELRYTVPTRWSCRSFLQALQNMKIGNGHTGIHARYCEIKLLNCLWEQLTDLARLTYIPHIAKIHGDGGGGK